jgi:Sec-independent protein translocase protein TatA|tara:strand:- start:9 stop:185 length:177 start_codon:yes stop_codon:yes gene_type:complete
MELIWVLLVALIILGPTKLVQFSKSIGKLLKSSRKWIHELQNSIDTNYKEEENRDEQN